MSLKETIKELKGKIEEEDKKEDAAPKKEEDAEQKAEEDKKEEEKPVIEEKPKEEPKVEEEKPDPDAYRRMRREVLAAKKLAEERETENAELRAKLAAPKEEVEEDTTQPDQEIEEIKQDRRMQRAEREFNTLESKFAADNPDYHDVSGEYALALAQSIKIQNPRMSNLEIAEKTKETLLLKAASFVNKGFDPIEELYQEAKELGFTGKKKTQEKEEKKEEEEIKPDMKKLAENRKRSAGMAGATGESKGQITKQAAGDYTNAEWARLPKEEKRRLLYG